MAPKNRQFYPTVKNRAWLYDFVFIGRISILVVLLLISSFLFQPINQALAQVENADEPVAEDVLPQVDEPAEEVPPPDVVTETIEEDTLDLGQDTEVLDEPATEQVPEEVTEDTIEDVAEEVEPTSTDDLNDVPTVVLDDGGITLPSIDDEEDEYLEPKEDTVKEAQYLVTDENFYQFSRQSCVAVGDGSYHCTLNDTTGLDEDAIVYADKGENGAKQIFLRTSKSGVKQLTSDNNDNTSPHYDPESKQVVWQRMIDGRYQIIVYNIEEGSERQLTFSRTNNMEPKASQEGIVWQAWDGNDWEIMYFDGTYTDQITDNLLQDVAPVTEDNYILWSVLGGNEQQARVYSLESKDTMTITGNDGGTIANPRFVLVYDTKFENGDIVTQGFDPVTGLSSPLGVTPAQEPVEIPDVDPLGEIRALINSKSQQEDDLDQTLNPDNASSSDTLQISKSSPDTLDLKSNDLSPDISINTSSVGLENDFELNDYDLVLVPTKLPPEVATGTLKLTDTSSQ